MLGGQSLMMVGVASRHCDPHCLGEVLGETLFEATLDPPSLSGALTLAQGPCGAPRRVVATSCSTSVGSSDRHFRTIW